jgi:hypothetical protein
MTRQNFQVRAHYLRLALVWYGLAVGFGLQNLNKLALGDMARQNFQVRGLILEIFLAWFCGLVWSAKLEQVGVWRYD